MDLLEDLKYQEAPFTIQVEPTEGCNLGCSFCGIRGIRKKGTHPWKHMTLATAERISSQIAKAGWNSKIVFAMHGEPTLNPHLYEIIKLFRDKLPNNLFYVITNGAGLVDEGEEYIVEYIKIMEQAGVNHLLVDNYSPDGDWSKIAKAAKDTHKVIFMEKKIPLFSASKKFDILILPPIKDVKIGYVRNLKNHCGAASPGVDGFQDKRCTVPFRELSFRYDGNVAICCDDFRGQYPIANIKDMSIVELWNHPRFQAARILLYNRERIFFPCNICNSVSMRVGLLPDKKGKEDLPEPDDELRKYAQDISKLNKPLAKIVKRKWDK